MPAFLRQVLQKIKTADRAHEMIRVGDSIVVGLSGGSDSAALLLALSKLKRCCRLRLFAAHLNHGLQGARASRFEKRARQISSSLGIPFYSKKISVRSLAKKTGRSLEETGRDQRYRFFLEIAEKTGSSKIATAHTLDDQAETVLLRLMRGSGLRGLSAIPFKRREGRTTLIRPVLLCQKKELRNILKEAGIRSLEDPTNQEDFFTRNRVRRRLLPFLETSFNPRIKEALSGLQSACAEAQDFIEREAKKVFLKSGVRQRKYFSIRVALLKRLHPALRNEVLRLALRAAKGDLKRFTRRHFEDLNTLLRSPEAGLKLHLPGVRAAKGKLDLDFSSR